MPVTKVKFENFTAFKELEVEFSPGINALIGGERDGENAPDEGLLCGVRFRQDRQVFGLQNGGSVPSFRTSRRPVGPSQRG